MMMTGLLIYTILLVWSPLCRGTVIPLHRTHPPSHKGNLAASLSRDLVRQRVITNFPLTGSDDPFIVGLYYTTLSLGTPAREYSVMIDTGSSLTWVSCQSCSGCPNTSTGITPTLYDPASSLSASLTGCSRYCSSCDDDRCLFDMVYGDGSVSAGYQVNDILQLSSIVPPYNRSSYQITFGCSTRMSGLVSQSPHSVGGLMGLGTGPRSVVTQLYSHGVTPHVFSHCLKGGDVGGGFLVFGKLVGPPVVYTPLLRSKQYSVRLSGIDINGQLLVSSNMLSSNGIPGISFDSGTTLTYLPESDYNSFAAAISKAVSTFGFSTVHRGYLCYVQNSSKPLPFPSVTLIFDGGAPMNLRPEDYLIYDTFEDGSTRPCLGFRKVHDQGIPILGEIAMKNKVVIYDIAGGRMGWSTDYVDCWKSFDVNRTYGSAPSLRYCSESSLWLYLLPLVINLLLCYLYKRTLVIRLV